MKMVISNRGGSENEHFQSRWSWKWTFSVEVVPKMNILSRGGSENDHFQSRWYWKYMAKCHIWQWHVWHCSMTQNMKWCQNGLQKNHFSLLRSSLGSVFKIKFSQTGPGGQNIDILSKIIDFCGSTESLLCCRNSELWFSYREGWQGWLKIVRNASEMAIGEKNRRFRWSKIENKLKKCQNRLQKEFLRS